MEQLLQGNFGVLVGWIKGDIATTPLKEVVSRTKPLDLSLLKLANVLAK